MGLSNNMTAVDIKHLQELMGPVFKAASALYTECGNAVANKAWTGFVGTKNVFQTAATKTSLSRFPPQRLPLRLPLQRFPSLSQKSLFQRLPVRSLFQRSLSRLQLVLREDSKPQLSPTT